ncbi:hypothetical protein DPMN_139795 [Dreissena polymorpha]|uniref:Ig-like domain-containing protein n=1 Tax=Dreissena polymorpha TaxID=45954 RepID=A0A9D4JGU3_DREPO|nr:hypothetical protein DPMN_139795 [Dreissena polymorpha]
MDFFKYFITIWIVTSTCITGIADVSSCNSTLSTDNNAFGLGTNVTLKCVVCPGSSEIKFKHNDSDIAVHSLDTQVTNPTLHGVAVNDLGNGSKEMKLTILNFTQSSNGVYSCSTSSTDVASLNIAYTVSTTPGSADGSKIFCYFVLAYTNYNRI